MRQKFFGARYFASKFLAGNIRIPVVLFSAIADYEKIIFVAISNKQIVLPLEVKVHGRVH